CGLPLPLPPAARGGDRLTQRNILRASVSTQCFYRCPIPRRSPTQICLYPCQPLFIVNVLNVTAVTPHFGGSNYMGTRHLHQYSQETESVSLSTCAREG